MPFKVKGGYAYLIHWPTSGIVKVGSTLNPSRWQPWLGTGGRLLALAKDTPQSHGDYAGVRVAEQFLKGLLPLYVRPVFGNADAASHLLPPKGSGWSECYADDGSVSLPLFTEVCTWLVWESCPNHFDNKCQYNNLHDLMWREGLAPAGLRQIKFQEWADRRRGA